VARAVVAVLLLMLVPSAAYPQRALQHAWTKWCYEGTVSGRDNDGKGERARVDTCATYRDHIDADTGILLSVALWQIQNQEDRKDLRVRLQVAVPLGSELKPGMRLWVVHKVAWENVKKDGKPPEDKGHAHHAKLAYSHCSPDGCTEAFEGTSALVDILKNGGGLVVEATSSSRGTATFRVPLAGFARALADERPLPRRSPRYDRPTNCDTVVDYKGPCSPNALLKGWHR
jgi:invasion protein IalB